MSTLEAKKKAWTKYNKSKKKKEADKRYRKNNVQKCKESWATYSAKNRKKISKRAKLWRQTISGKKSANKSNKQRKENGKSNQRYNERYRKDLHFKIIVKLRARQRIALKSQNASKSQRTIKSAGCTLEFLIKHLESLFKKGMSWDNYGEWHVDHIKPCSLFDLTQKKEQQKCFHYTNLQPLWGLENLDKRDQYDWNEKHEKLLGGVEA